MGKIKIGIIGLGNCASALIQGIAYYSQNKSINEGLMHRTIGAYTPDDIDVVLAIDVDARKVGRPIEDAMFALPNCTKTFCKNISNKTPVIMGKVLDGVSEHTQAYLDEIRVVVSQSEQADMAAIVDAIKKSGAEMLVNYLPVGSQLATEFYAECALQAKVGFINCIPVFIASDDKWIAKFKEQGLPCIGDDIKSQLGATIVHRELMRLFEMRGIKITHTYQLNTGGNTDFLNMLNRDRLHSKKVSKTEAVQSNIYERLQDKDIHVGPSDFVQWQHDNKICFLRIEGEQFGGVPMNLELRLSVEDSPNSAGIVIDAIRCLKLALDNKLSGNIIEPSAYFMKHPKIQMEDFSCREKLEEFINEYADIN